MASQNSKTKSKPNFVTSYFIKIVKIKKFLPLPIKKINNQNWTASKSIKMLKIKNDSSSNS